MTIERQLVDHPPLQVCFPNHRPRMFESRGGGMVCAYVECQLCGVRTHKLDSANAAATAWAKRDVVPINQHAAMQKACA